MQNGKAPFDACVIELVMRILATVGLSGIIGYTSVCIASPLAWFGACVLLIPVYYKMMKIPDKFKNASAFLLRDARHAMHDILLLRISAILPEAISDGGLTPTTDTDLLLATYSGSHLTSDIKPL